MTHTHRTARRDTLRHLLCSTILASTALAGAAAQAQPGTPDGDGARGWFARAWGGYSHLADTAGRIDSIDLLQVIDSVDVSTSAGFTAGAGVGFRYGPHVAVELAWEYRSNDTETDFGTGLAFDGGNYASNIFFLNGFYHFASRGRWDPYVGAGLAFVQEVDIDLEGNGPEQSFSGDGETGFQVFAGANYHLTAHWRAHGELRYGRFGDIDLDGENVAGTIRGFDYEPLTVQVGLSYRF